MKVSLYPIKNYFFNKAENDKTIKVLILNEKINKF